MKKIILILIQYILILNINAQDKVVSIRDICSFIVPSNMEVREDGALADKAAKKFYSSKEVTYNNNSIILQPKGFDNINKTATGLYGRIIVSLEQGKKGEYVTISEMSKEDIDLAKYMIIEILKDNARKYQMSILNHSSVSIKKIGEKLAFYHNYTRKSARGKMSPVFVQEYRVLDDDKAIQITLSYRSTEKEIWESGFNEFIKSLKFK